MSKGLEALERIKSHNYNKCSKKECIATIEKELQEKEKTDKALEIINKKNVNIYKIKICDNVEEYNKLRNTGKELTTQEFELMKGIMK